ncbi:MAG TPA: ACT domain-containing protein [Mariprofundaceae bacterium]|nr:ACT domain-containing protein [Mariprofundaceae bacterium]
MPYVLLSVSGHDRPGIVRDVAEALLHLDANIEDSSMTALRGRFTMMLIVRLPEEAGLGGLKGALADLEQRTGLTIQSQPISDEEARAESAAPDCVVTVHGADRMGIVHAVTEAVAACGASVVDLSTRMHGSDAEAVYMMALEVHTGGRGDVLRDALKAVASRLGVDIAVHDIDETVL